MCSSKVATLAVLLVVAACSTPPRAADISSTAKTASTREAAPQSADDFSLYELASRWQDQTGTSRSLSSLAGQPRVLGMIYTSCRSTCPMIVEAMKRIEKTTSDNVAFVLISLDPERDSASRLLDYAREHGLSNRWTLLTGSSENVRELTAAIGSRLQRTSPTELAHSNTIVVLDARGRITAQQPSWDTDGVLAALPRRAGP